MDPSIKSNWLQSDKGKLHYLSTGPSDGRLMIFIHGWPGLAICWRPQLLHFAALGYRCVAMDTLGYGQSPAPRDIPQYSCESLVADQLLLLSSLNAKSAIWVAHDWGCGPLWTLAAHHPEVCDAVVSICVPYRMLELGLDKLLQTVNRELYPEKEFPYGQWDYQVYYESDGDGASKAFDDYNSESTKLVFSKGNPKNFMQPARTANVTKDGWFGGKHQPPPDIPLSMTVLDEGLYEMLRESLGRNGWWPATAYYLNHSRNSQYNHEDNIKNGGVLEMPVLHIDAKYDGVCSLEQNPKFGEEQRRLCKNYDEAVVETGHWANLEKPDECNAYIEGFLKKNGLRAEQQGKL